MMSANDIKCMIYFIVVVGFVVVHFVVFYYLNAGDCKFFLNSYEFTFLLFFFFALF